VGERVPNKQEGSPKRPVSVDRPSMVREVALQSAKYVHHLL
jgi:hypothetical protein